MLVLLEIFDLDTFQVLGIIQSIKGYVGGDGVVADVDVVPHHAFISASSSTIQSVPVAVEVISWSVLKCRSVKPFGSQRIPKGSQTHQ